MIDFKPLELSDKDWIDELVFAEGSRSADFNFGNRYMWDARYSRLISRIGDRIISKPKCSSKLTFDFPIGTGDLAPVIEKLKGYSRNEGVPLHIRGVTCKQKEELERLFPGRFSFREDRDQFDYVYSAEKLATLAGKKLHGKRNHINRFLAENDWSFEPMTADSLPECYAMLCDWTRKNQSKEDFGIDDERTAIRRGLDNFDVLKLEGGILRVGGKGVAFTVGELIAEDTFDVHIEKAPSNMNGAYPMVNREFVRQIMERHPKVTYINREDDMGIENLRKAKLSYYPEFLVEKNTACWE